jgi:hypothetical protein
MCPSMALVLLIHIIPSKNPHSQLLLMAVPRIHIMPLVNMIPSKNPHTLMLLMMRLSPSRFPPTSLVPRKLLPHPLALYPSRCRSKGCTDLPPQTRNPTNLRNPVTSVPGMYWFVLIAFARVSGKAVNKGCTDLPPQTRNPTNLRNPVTSVPVPVRLIASARAPRNPDRSP